MFNEKAFCADWVGRHLYDPTKPGLIVLRGFLDADFRESLLQEINRHAHVFKPAPRKHLNAHQEFSYFCVGEADEGPVPGNFPAVLALRDRYSDLYRSLRCPAKFSAPWTLNSIVIQKYPARSIGITLHRDSSRYLNAISIFVLKGEAPFFVSFNRNPFEATVIETDPRDLILLRGPRNPQSRSEKWLRPFHAVGRVLEERITLLLRERAEP